MLARNPHRSKMKIPNRWMEDYQSRQFPRPTSAHSPRTIRCIFSFRQKMQSPDWYTCNWWRRERICSSLDRPYIDTIVSPCTFSNYTIRTPSPWWIRQSLVLSLDCNCCTLRLCIFRLFRIALISHIQLARPLLLLLFGDEKIPKIRVSAWFSDMPWSSPGVSGTWVAIVGVMYRLCCGEHVNAQIDNWKFFMHDLHRPKIPSAIRKFSSIASTIFLSQHTKSVSAPKWGIESISSNSLSHNWLLFTIFINVRTSIEQDAARPFIFRNVSGSIIRTIEGFPVFVCIALTVPNAVIVRLRLNNNYCRR